MFAWLGGGMLSVVALGVALRIATSKMSVLLLGCLTVLPHPNIRGGAEHM